MDLIGWDTSALWRRLLGTSLMISSFQLKYVRLFQAVETKFNIFHTILDYLMKLGHVQKSRRHFQDIVIYIYLISTF